MSTNLFVKMLNKLQTDFSSRFLDVKLQKNSWRLFKNPFNIDENNVDTSLQLQVIELKESQNDLKIVPYLFIDWYYNCLVKMFNFYS